MSDAPLTDCPECNESSLRKLVSAAGFRLSGGGWYETDFKSGGGRNLAEKDTKAGKESGDSKKSEQKSKSADKPAAAGSSATS